LGQTYVCSDGSVLTLVKIRYESPEAAARDRDQFLRGEASLVGAGIIERCIPAGMGAVVQFRSPMRIAGDPAGRTGAWAYLDVSGREVRLLYGPSREHVVELLAANPCHQW